MLLRYQAGGVGCSRDPATSAVWTVGGWAHLTGEWKTSNSHYSALLVKARNICSYEGCCSCRSPGQKPCPGNSAPLSCLLWLLDRNASIWKERSSVWEQLVITWICIGTLWAKHLCQLTCVLVFMQCIFPYGQNLEGEITSQNRIKHHSSEHIPEFERHHWIKPPNSSFYK